jgi:hypothetical protein
LVCDARKTHQKKHKLKRTRNSNTQAPEKQNVPAHTSLQFDVCVLCGEEMKQNKREIVKINPKTQNHRTGSSLAQPLYQRQQQQQ